MTRRKWKSTSTMKDLIAGARFTVKVTMSMRFRSSFVLDISRLSTRNVLSCRFEVLTFLAGFGLDSGRWKRCKWTDFLRCRMRSWFVGYSTRPDGSEGAASKFRFSSSLDLIAFAGSSQWHQWSYGNRGCRTCRQHVWSKHKDVFCVLNLWVEILKDLWLLKLQIWRV